VGITVRDSCREHFRKLKVLPFQSQYIYSLSLFVINNKYYFKVNSEIHNINTRTESDLHLPLSHLSISQKGTYYMGIKVFNSLPVPIKDLSHNIEQFKSALKSFLYFHSICTLDDYFDYKKNSTFYHVVELFVHFYKSIDYNLMFLHNFKL
jgi:hypothetical protein